MSRMMDQKGDAAIIGPQIEEMLKNGEQVQLVVSGDSMRPTLKPGRDAAILEALDAWPPRKGDILFFKSERSQSGYTLHRAIRIRGEGPIMNGDAQNWVEGPIPREQVLGVAVALVRGGKVIDGANRPYRLYTSLWGVTRPVRWPLFALYRGIKRLIGKR